MCEGDIPSGLEALGKVREGVNTFRLFLLPPHVLFYFQGERQ